MPMPVTEVAFVPLRADADIDNISSPDGRKWKAIVDSVCDKQGFISGHLGRQHENHNTIMHFIGTVLSSCRRN